MAEVNITSIEQKNAKKWIQFSFRPPTSAQRYEENIYFTGSQRNRANKFIKAMDGYSVKSSKMRQCGTKQLSSINKVAKNRLIKYGASLFSAISQVKSKSLKSFSDLFGDESNSVILNLDKITRRYPWELAFDGQEFLCTKYSVGRASVIKPEVPPERLSGSEPLNNKALVVGLNYDWPESKYDELRTPESEALQVSKRLQKLGYKPILLRGADATVKEVSKVLSDELAIFHYTGHGNCYSNQPVGRKGRICLFDGELKEDELRLCFNKAKGAPYLSFLNACKTAKEIYDNPMIDTFLDFGCEHVVGNLWSVYDEPSRNMAVRFYDYLVEGETIGWSLTRSRWQYSQSRKGIENATWPALVLYGSPNNILPHV